MEWLNIITETDAFKTVSGTVGKNKAAAVIGMPPVQRAAFVSAASQALHRPFLVITANDAEAVRFTEDAQQFLGAPVGFYPSKDFTLLDAKGVSREADHDSLSVLGRIVSGKCQIVACSVEAYISRTTPKDRFINSTISISIGKSIHLKGFIETLVSSGYLRTATVEGKGTFAVRGGIVDIWPPDADNPCRIEFWGDTVDEISVFDPGTQRRTGKIRHIDIIPASEIIPESCEKAAELLTGILAKTKNEKYREILKRDIDLYKGGSSTECCDRYLPAFLSTRASLANYFTDPVYFVSDPTAVTKRAKELTLALAQEYLTYKTEGLTGYIYSDFYDPYSIPSDAAAVYSDMFARSLPGVELDSVSTVTGTSVPKIQSTFHALSEQVSEYCRNGFSAIIFAATEKEADNLNRDFVTIGMTAARLNSRFRPVPGTIAIGVGTLNSGFEYPGARLLVLTGAKNGAPKKKSKLSSQAEKNMFGSLEDLRYGDYVVHSTHGIGRYEGIKRIDHYGMVKDYIKIAYSGEDVLYLPVTQLNMISPYMSADDGAAPKVAKLYSGEWQKTKQRIYKSVKEMARELIALYARREMSDGIKYPPDDDWQRDFESRFIYEETADQLKSAGEIKRDMEKSRPMDRLLCGDVGVGKTEVAMRAAFKCVDNSYQCAVLVPTTILAWQHYNSFLERMEPFPVKVAMLSRFTSAKDMKAAVEGIRNGTVDIAIGTHRLLQKDIDFKKLGLVIVDEEQRFGVAHKEALKEKAANVDVLTLSATPIPRTLNMAMSGIRDMSVIEEAPENRLPISTYVLEYDQSTIDSAIARELARGGQVYYLHNRVDSIERTAAAIKERFPDAEVAVAHGKMDDEHLSRVWQRLINGEIDILVCTTIIESGVDIANCNTLIVEDSDRLGLSQLYQIRGRVGRSSRRAYAYFTFRGGMALTEVAEKRLSAIRDFTSLGSGFKIAMRDLQIRGAGSVLSAKQSGHMAAVGYETYLQILEDAIAEETGNEPPERPKECLIDFSENAFLPEKYIGDLSSRISMYKRIAAIENEEDAEDVMDEMGDRFGPIPQPAGALVDTALTKAIAMKLGIYEIRNEGSTIYFYLDHPDPVAVSALVKDAPRKILFSPKGKSYISATRRSQEGFSEAALSVVKQLIQITGGGKACL